MTEFEDFLEVGKIILKILGEKPIQKGVGRCAGAVAQKRVSLVTSESDSGRLRVPIDLQQCG